MAERDSSGKKGIRLFGLIGYPLSHSFSKKYFDQKFLTEGLTDCQFENFPIPSILDLPLIVKENPALQGMAVTIPYKRAVFPYLENSDQIAASLNACNCIRIRNGKLKGYNTDYIGFEKSLVPHLQSYHKKALVLGNGGATAAIVFVLRKLGIEPKIVSRQLPKDSSILYKDLDQHLMNEHLLIINTTPAGMYPDTNSYPDIPYGMITSRHFLFDLIYNPAKTEFLRKGEIKGATIKNGEEMLAIQAEENWKIWTQDQ
jgi:shikimate dehydrogenase